MRARINKRCALPYGVFVKLTAQRRFQMEFKGIFSVIISALLALFSPGSQVTAPEEIFLPEAENDSMFAVIDEDEFILPGDIEPQSTYSTSKDGVEDFAEKYIEYYQIRYGSCLHTKDELIDSYFRLESTEFDECGYKIFMSASKILDIYYSFSAYIIYNDNIHPLGDGGCGGEGITGIALADVNGDGLKELYFSDSWCGSGVPGWHLMNCFDPANMEIYNLHGAPRKIYSVNSDWAYGYTNYGLRLVPCVGEDGKLHAYKGGLITFDEGIIQMYVGEEYGEIVYENNEYQLKPYNE